MAELNARVFIEVSHLEPAMNAVLQRLRWRPPAPPRRGVFGRLLGPRRTPLRHDHPLELLAGLGLGAWSNTLHVDVDRG